MMELTQVQKTLIDQLKMNNRYFEVEYNIKAIITIKNGLRLHTKNRGRIINIDIVYNYGKDLYEIKAYLIKRRKADFEQIGDFNDIYFDQLHEIIRSILFREAG